MSMYIYLTFLVNYKERNKLKKKTLCNGIEDVFHLPEEKEKKPTRFKLELF